MTNYRTNLINRMVQLYQEEDCEVIRAFNSLCENFPDTATANKALNTIVESHEKEINMTVEDLIEILKDYDTVKGE